MRTDNGRRRVFRAASFLAASFFAAAATLPAQQSGEPHTLPLDLVTRPWTGDLPGMIQRRMIRMLVPYSQTHYFIEQGVQRGILYEAGKALEDLLNKQRGKGKARVEVVFVAVSREELLPALVAGRGDIAAGMLTITEERRKTVDFTEPTAHKVDEIVVTGPRSPEIRSVEDLAGLEAFVRKSSSYYESLQALNRTLRGRGKAQVRIKPAPESLEDEDLLEMVSAGLVKIVVVDSLTAVFWKQVLPKLVLHEDVAVRTGGELAWAIRKGSPKLKAELDGFVKTHGLGTTFGNTMLRRYLKSTKFVESATNEAEMKRFATLVGYFRKYADQYSMDYLLMIAQGFQESRLDQNARSQVGAIGVMQVMPATGKELAVGDIHQSESNIHAGVKYIRFMIDRYYANEPMDRMNKTLFAFASYNAGPARVRQLREEAKKQGLNPNVWFGNVERIAAQRIGRETVQYVSNIYKYYVAYSLALEEVQERDKAKAAAGAP